MTAKGAAVILAHALLLGAIDLAGSDRRAWPWVLSVLPIVSGTWLMRMPGVASAVAGAYLLPRSLLVLAGWLALPPLLLAPAMAFDVIVWLRPDDVPRRRSKWHRRDRRPRELQRWRVAAAVLAYEVVLLLAG